jgi:hypothetical protein
MPADNAATHARSRSTLDSKSIHIDMRWTMPIAEIDGSAATIDDAASANWNAETRRRDLSPLFLPNVADPSPMSSVDVSASRVGVELPVTES